MKKIFAYFSLIASVTVYSQNTIVRYVEYRKDVQQTNVSFLIYDDKSSLNFPIYNKDYKTYQELLNDKSYTEDERNIRNYTKKDLYSNEFFVESEVVNKPFLYRDEIPTINWTFEKGSEKILNYDCNIATAKFRGRNYKVWYAKEIPVPIGPWKLGGLPGLILKVDGDKGEYTFEATELVFNSKLPRPHKFVDLYTKYSKYIIPFSKYVEVENKLNEEQRQKIIAQLPKNTNLTISSPSREGLIELEIE